MKKILYIFILLCFASCVKERTPAENIIIGSTNVDLNANDSVIRAQEAVIGNLIADAHKIFAQQRGFNIDFSFINGGSIRFNEKNRPDGIYPKGPISNYDIEEMEPFFEYGSVINISGSELIKVFERSAAKIEEENGGFLHFSSGVELVFDLNEQAQLIDNTVFPSEIAQLGSRVTSIKINGDTLDVNKTYMIFTNSFIASGGDDYVTLREIPDNKKTEIEEELVTSLLEYFTAYSPVNPQIENRITIIP